MDRISPQMLALAGGEVTLFTGKTSIEPIVEMRPRLSNLVRWLVRWRWVLLGGLLAGALLGVVVTLLLPKQYASTARLEISRETSRVVNIDSVERDTSVGDQEFYQTQYGLLHTQALAERVARDLGVVDDPAFFRMFGQRDAFEGKLGGNTAAARAKRNEMAGKILLLHVAIAPVRGSSLVDVRAVTPDPTLSQRIADTWSQDFIASNLERRFDASSYARKFLETRLEQLRDKLEASERDAVSYAAQQGIINLPSSGDPTTGGLSGGRSLVTDDLTSLNAALDAATAERIEAQAKLRAAQRPDASNIALQNDAINALRQKRADVAAEYAKVMEQFTPSYPPAKALASQVQSLDAAIAKEEDRVRASLRQSYDSSLGREQALAARVEMLKGALTDLQRRSIQYNIYQRDADTNRELYNAILQRYKEIGVAGGIDNNNVAIVDAAKVPDHPSSPKLLLDVILAMLAGLLAAAAAATVLDQIDEGIAEPAQVQEKLGLPLLGIAPRLKTGHPLQALQDPRSKLVEAYLALQANLELSTAQGTPRSLAVISTRPREGKSTTTVALAQSLARAHRKVVLVDADLRAPSIHSVFGISNLVGVSTFLAGMDEVEKIIQATDVDGLWVLAAGPQPPNAAELLMGERLPMLITRLKEQFDHVIVDAPPVIGLADAPLVAAAVDSVIYAVETHAAPASSIRFALQRLKTAQARILGAVLTKYDTKQPRLGYGYDYGYGYGYDYGREAAE